MKRTFTLLKSVLVVTALGSAYNAVAQFSGDFDPTNWTYYSVGPNSTGYVDASGAPSSITMYGNDSYAGDCCNLYDDYSILLTCSGTISFDYNHINPDIDDAWYTINGTEYLITYSGSGSMSGISVNMGDVFSFRIKTYDDCCGQGILTISNFSFAPGAGGGSSALGPDFSLCPSDTYWLTVPSGAGYTYLWNDASTNDSLQVTGPGTYYVYVDQGGGCTYSDTVAVTQTTAITFTGSMGPVCMGDPVLPLTAVPSSDPNPGITTQGIWSGTGVSAGGINIDTVKIMDASGGDTLTWGPDLCTNGLTAMGTYTSNPFMLGGSSSIVDSIRFTVAHTSCDASYNWNIYVNGVLIETIAGLYPNTCSCTPGTPIELVVSSDPGINTNWNIGGANTIAIEYTGFSENHAGVFAEIFSQGNIFDAAVAGPGQHTISYSVCNLSDSFDVIVMDTTQIVALDSAAICNGNTVTLTSNIWPGLGYSSWSNGETTDTITVSNGGIYVLTNTYCGFMDSYMLVSSPDVVATATTTTAVSGGDGAIDLTVFGGTPGFTFDWSNGATTEDLTGLNAGVYDVVVTDANGCVDSLSVYVGMVGINEEDPNFGITVYPNPTTDVFNLMINSAENYTGVSLEIINSLGQNVYSESITVNAGSNAQLIDLGQFDSGLYIIRISLNDRIYLTKVTLQ